MPVTYLTERVVSRGTCDVLAGSLFSGVGGLDYGLHRAGFQHAFFCESDEWRRTVLAHHWPGVPIYEDVLGGDAIGSHARIDLLCGGFP
jgi:DNA (cytosine-5)-methyltransferase 1